MNYRPPPYQGYNTVQPGYAAPNAGGTTVVVQQDRPGYIGGGGGGDFAMGMLLGGAIGTAWGSHHHGWGYGHGWGGGHSSQVHDTDITINNYYDNDTTTVNNNLDMTNNFAIEQAAVPESGDVVMGDMIPIEDAGGIFDGGDFGGGDFDGGDFGGGDFGDF